MVAIFTGLGAGAERGSANVLGSAGLLGSGTLGRSGERVLLNAATGNLMIQQQDEMLVGRGPDAMIGRTYNSLGDLSDENGDNWRQSTDRRVYGLAGTQNATGSTVKRMSADGSDITYTWNASAGGYIATDGSGAYDKLVWTSSNSTWTWTDGDTQATESYGYVATTGKYLITKATDANGNALTYSYLTGGKLNRVTTADGSYTQYGWSGNNITQILTGYTDLATGSAKTLTRTRYGYDTSNRLTTVTVDLSPGDNSIADGKTYVTTYGYDGTSKRVASITQTDGSSLTVTYDTSGRVKTMVQTAASGVTRTTTITYQTGYTNISDPAGQITRLDYNASGQLTKITGPAPATGIAQQVTQFGYNTNGDLTSVVDPAGSTTSYSNFTAFGEAQTITDRLGAVTTRTFGAKNELLTQTTTGADQSGAAVQHTSRYVYDANDRVRFELSPDGNVVEHRYDDTKGGVETLTLAYTGQTYDLSALTATQIPTLAQMTSWAAATDQTALSEHSYQYDARGNLTASYGYGTLDSSGTGTAQSGTFYTYDQAGQLLSTNTYQHAAETYVYDGLGRVVSSVDLEGGTTSIVFNDAATSTVVTLASGLVQTSTYNKAGDLVSYAESGANTTAGTTTYKYDAFDRIRMATDATGHNSYIVYDKVGRKVDDIDHYGRLTEYKYDADGRVVASVTYATYITAAQLASLANVQAVVEAPSLRPAADARDVWTWNVYDKEGRVLETIDGTGHAVQYEYDPSGRLVRTTAYRNTLPDTTVSGFMTTAPTTVTLPTADAAHDTVSRIFYDKSGRIVGSLDGEGYLSKVVYDAAGRKVAETDFANATAAANRALGSFASLTAGLADAAADRTTRYVYDGQGLLVFTVDPLNHVTESVYPAADVADVNGMARQTIRYAGTIAAPGAWTVAGVRAALSNAGLAGNGNNRSSWAIYDSRNNLTYAIDGAGSVTGYTYDASGNVVAMRRYAVARTTDTLPDSATMDSWAAGKANSVTRYVYDALNRRIITVDAEGDVTRTSYDALGQAAAVRQYATPIPRATLDGYPAAISVAQATVAASPGDRVSRALYDADGREIYAIDAGGYVTERRYDAIGNLTSMIRYADKVSVDDTVTAASLAALLPATIPATAIVTGYSYDRNNRLIQENEDQGTNRLNVSTSYSYDGQGNVVATVDTLGRVTHYAYDRLDRQIWSVDAAGYAAETRYDAFGEARTTIEYANPVADAATLAAWPLQVDAGQIGAGVSASNADRTARSYYDTDGRPVYAIDGEGYVTETRYDAVGNVTATIRYSAPVAATDSMRTADVAALLPASIPADAAVTSYAYDRANRLTDTTDATGSVTHFDLDALGDIVGTTVAYGTAQAATTSRTFDQVGRMTHETLAAGTSAASGSDYGYDAFGDVLTIAGPTSSVSRRSYDALGRVISDYVPVDAQTGHDLTTSKTYDAFGRVVRVTDPNGNVGYFHYDHLDRLTVQVDPEGYVTQTTYTATGQKESVTRYANRATALGDTVAMPAITSSPKDAITTFGYDKLDRLVTTSDAQGNTERYALNAFGDRIAVTNKLGGVTFNAFDRRGLLVSETTQVRWIDPAQNLAMGSNITNSYAYDSRGNLQTKIEAFGRPEARTTRYGYDKLDRLTLTTHDAVDVLTDPATGTTAHVSPAEHATYDLRGNLIENIDAAGARTLSYYDGQDRKIAEVNALGTLTTWQYDANGNALSQRVYGDSVPLPAVAGGSPPSPVAPANYRETGYSYDRNNRLIATSVTGAVVGRYNGSTYQTTQGVTTGLVYDGLGNVVRETDGNGGATFHYFDKLGREVAKVDPEGYLTTWQRDAEGNVTLERRYANRVTGSFDQSTAVATLVANTPADAANDRVTAFTYNRNGQRTQEVRLAVTGLMNGATGGQLGATDAVIRYTYNALGEVLSKHEATGDTTNYTYDDSGRLIRQQDAAIASLGNLRHTTDFAYDGLNDVLSTRESAAANTSAPDVLDASLIPPPPPPVPLPITTTTIGYESVDGNGRVTGTAGNDLMMVPLNGYANFVDLVGGDGDDRLINGSWSGGLYGGAGNDVLDFRANDQTGTGGAGSDFFVFDLGNIGEDTWALDPQYVWATVTDFTKGVDKIAILNSARSFADLTLTQNGSNVEITMLNAPKIVVQNMTVANLTASDFIISRGTDTPARQPSNVVYSPITTADVAFDGAKSDGNAGNDAIFVGSSANGGADGAELFGHAGDDHLITESWNSQINGGDGNDVLEIRNSDVLAIGGSGDDTFVFDISKFKGADYSRTPDTVWAQIVGFTSGRDRIVIPGRSYGDLTIAQVGNNVEISMANAPRIVLQTMAVADLAPSDFLFPTNDATTPAPVPTAAPTTTAVTPGADDRVTTFAYGAGGRLLSQTDASGFAHSFAYDAAGRVVRDSYNRARSDGTIVTEGQFTGYDALGRVVSHYTAALSGGTWQSGDLIGTSYNAYGEVSARSVNGVVQTWFDYDNAGHLWRSNADDGATRYYVYDANGNQTLKLESSGADIRGMSLDQVLQLSSNKGTQAIGDDYADGVVATINVYDKRNALVERVLPMRRLGGLSPVATQTVWSTYNAFGEEASKTDALGYTTYQAYNTMGRLTTITYPQVDITNETGTTVHASPVEHYFYDVSGRRVGHQTPNGALTHQSLIEGSGYDGTQALVMAEWHPDGGVVRNTYDVFGDVRDTTDENGLHTQMSYDGLGRLVQMTRDGLTDYYTYDVLGQRIRHTDSYQTLAETTDYDQQGRIVSQHAFNDELTTNSYVWDSSITAQALGTHGGWVQTTTYANGRTSVESTDVFAHVITKTDLGGHVYSYTYDFGGHLAKISGNHFSDEYEYTNSGLVENVRSGDIIDNQFGNYQYINTGYFYDARGDKVGETTTRTTHYASTPGDGSSTGSGTETFEHLQDASATFDALGRMTSWQEVGNATIGNYIAPPASITYQYDADGNIRHQANQYTILNPDGSFGTTASQDYWYRYDAMDRMVADKGTLLNGQIVRGTDGVDLTYDAGGRRRTATSSQILTNANGTYAGARRETYDYGTSRQLQTVTIAQTDPSGQFTLTGGGSSFQYDGLGRMTRQTDTDASGAAVYDRQVGIDGLGRVSNDVVVQRQGSATITVISTYTFGSGASYALGSPLSVQSSTRTDSGGTIQTTTSQTDYSYAWYDAPVQASISYKPDINGSTVNTTTLTYNGMGVLKQAQIADGRPRTVSYATNALGQVLRRDEVDGNASTGDPHEVFYLYDGRELGTLNTDGTFKTDYAGSVAARTAAQQTGGAFRNGATTGSFVADFDPGYTPITSYSQGSSGGSYTVRAGDTLQSIAQQLYGDAGLWYKIAQANGITGDYQLREGQSLTLPRGVLRSANNADTYRAYDPASVIGDITPDDAASITTPKPQAQSKKHGCGVFGQILLAVVAIAVTVVTAGTIGPVAAAVLGNVVSQGVGLATGIQDKFSFKSVALTALTAGVTQGLGKIGVFDKLEIAGNGFVDTAARGALSNAVTQGVAVATGLQSKFDWTGVAAAGIGAGVGSVVGGLAQKAFHLTQTASGAFVHPGDAAAYAGLSGGASAIANAATRSLIDGTDFGDNIVTALPDVIGSTIGQLVAGGIAEIGKPKPAELGSGGNVGPLVRQADGTLINPDAFKVDINDPQFGILNTAPFSALEMRIGQAGNSGSFGGFPITNQPATAFTDYRAGYIQGLTVKGNELTGTVLVSIDSSERVPFNEGRIMSALQDVNQRTTDGSNYRTHIDFVEDNIFNRIMHPLSGSITFQIVRSMAETDSPTSEAYYKKSFDTIVMRPDANVHAIVHEVFHNFGLGHSGFSGSVMFPAAYANDTNVRLYNSELKSLVEGYRFHK